MLKPYNIAQLSFSLGTEIGHEGQNSKVFIAHDPQLNTNLVIKQIPKTSFGNENEYFEESGVLHLSGHPNVVPIHYACEDIDHVYLAMPYYQRGSLNQLLNQRFLTVREIVKFSSQFLSGLHNIHSKKLIHFDVKPDNVLLSDQGEALVSDFGLCKPTASNGLAGQDRMYLKMLPPEAYTSYEFGATFDIYQAGLTLYRMTVGNQEFYRQFNSYGAEPNFDRNSFKFDVNNGRFPSRDQFPEHIPQAIIEVIKKSLDPNPSNRYGAVIHMVNALADIEGELLDWSYKIEASGERIWTKSMDGKHVSLKVATNGTSVAKKGSTDQNQRNIREYCLPSINRSQIKSFLRSF